MTGTYYSITPLGKMLLVKYGSDISKAIRESKKYLEDENAIQKMDESKCSNETVKHEWHILDSLVRLMTKLDALKLENGLPDLEELSFAQKLSSRTAHQIHEYYLSDEWKRLPKSLQDELRQLSVILLTFGDLKDHSRLLLSAKRAYKSTNETIALLRQ